ncbi:hypothetical protein [Embleya sp. NPDC001921]
MSGAIDYTAAVENYPAGWKACDAPAAAARNRSTRARIPRVRAVLSPSRVRVALNPNAHAARAA